MKKHKAFNTKISDQPAVYVGTYKKYNEGSIFGAWIDLTEVADKEEFYELCAELHDDEDDPEFMFQDYQSIPEGLMGESWMSDNLFPVLNKLNELRDSEREAFMAYIDYNNHDISNEDIDDIYNDFQDAYQGEYDSDEDFAQEIAEEFGMINEKVSWPYTCIDWEYAARELMYDYYEVNGYYFRS